MPRRGNGIKVTNFLKLFREFHSFTLDCRTEVFEILVVRRYNLKSLVQNGILDFTTFHSFRIFSLFYFVGLFDLPHNSFVLSKRFAITGSQVCLDLSLSSSSLLSTVNALANSDLHDILLPTKL